MVMLIIFWGQDFTFHQKPKILEYFPVHGHDCKTWLATKRQRVQMSKNKF